jgi:hypothetical protein
MICAKHTAISLVGLPIQARVRLALAVDIGLVGSGAGEISI